MEIPIFHRSVFLILTIAGAIHSAVSETSQSPLASLVQGALTQYSEYVKLRQLDNSLAGTEQNPETRGQSGGHGNGYGAITLDPVSIISLLALGAFLINNILQLLRANTTPAPPGRRSLGSSFPESILASLTDSDIREYDENGEPNFSNFFESVGSLYYLQPKKRNLCIKKVVCGYVNAQKARDDSGQGSFKTSVFDFMLSILSRVVVPELTSHSPVKDEVCKKFNKMCSDSLLNDAKVSVKQKVYSEVSNIISALTVRQLMG